MREFAIAYRKGPEQIIWEHLVIHRGAGFPERWGFGVLDIPPDAPAEAIRRSVAEMAGGPLTPDAVAILTEPTNG